MTGGMGERVAALVAAYRRVAETDMVGVPICNPALAVEAVGFRAFGPGWLGAVVTPWFLNALLVPADPARWADVPNCILTPHTGGATDAAVAQMAQMLLANIRAFVAEEPLPNRVL